ncbi:CD1375 family protein [Gorillibacterium sp. sgz500922]
MVRIYVDLIGKGLWTIENVPARWKAEVQAALDVKEAEAGV